MSVRKVLPLVVLCACGFGIGLNGDRPDMFGIEYDYVLGYHPDFAESIYGGSHYVVELGNEREAMNSANAATKVHPELKGEYAKYNPSLDRGETDFDVFASSWWPQSKNGIAWRWNGTDDDMGDDSDVDGLSPAEKYDRVFNPGQKKTVKKVEHWNYSQLLEDDESARGDKHDHPEVVVEGPATEWEMKNHGVYQNEHHPDSWWGHCNGWAAYVTTEAMGAPQRDIRIKLVDGEVTECTGSDTSDCTLFRMGDIEALMSEVYFNDQATFGGQRCNTRPDEMERDEYGRPKDEKCRDLNAGTFHIAATGLLGKGATHLASNTQAHPAFVIDHNYDYQVWNFPVVKYEVTETAEVTEERASELVGADQNNYQWNTEATKFVRVAMTYYMVSDSVGASAMLKQADDRNIALHPVRLNYVLELDDNDTILGGEWISDPSTSWGGENSKELHPDFLWIATNSRGYYENDDDTGGYSDNPYISKFSVDKLLKCSNDPSTCAPADGGGDDNTGGDDGNTGGGDEASCADNCGGSVTVDGETCYCDDQCTTYGDCCGDYTAECATGGDDGGSTGGGDTGGGDTGGTTETLTCDGNCGGSVTVDGETCYCDDSCTDYGDCCDDYTAECATGGNDGGSTGGGSTGGDTGGSNTGTCAGSCGSSDPAPGSSPECYCDNACSTYGDCCDDYTAECDS